MVPLQVSIKLWYGLFFAVAAVACLGSLARARTVEDRATRHGLVGLLLTSGLWAVTYLGVLYSPGVTLKEVWYTGGLIVGFGTVFAWLYFCSAYTDRVYHTRRPYQYVGLALYGIVVVIKLTNPLHEQYFAATIVQSPFPHLAIMHGPAHWVATGLAYVLAAIGMFMLYESFVEAGYRTRPLIGLTGLTALPVTLDLLAFESSAIIDIIYAPLGVAAFAVGVLFAVRERFFAVQLTGNVSEPVLFLDEADRVREFNDAAVGLFPSLSGAVGKPVSTVTPLTGPPDGQEVLEVDDEETSYYLINESDLATAQASVDRMLVFVDVTRLERQRRELERHNDQLEDFSAGIRHELLNSLQVVGGRVSAAGNALETGDVSEARQRLGTVSDRTDEMVTVVDGLSTLARHGKTIDGLEAIDLAAVAEDAHRSVRAGQITVTIGRTGAVEADWTRLQELLASLFEFYAVNGVDDVTITATDDGFAVETEWQPPERLDDDQLFEYAGGLTDTENGLSLPKVRTLARVQGWGVTLERRADGSRIVVDDATVHEIDSADSE